MFDTISQVGIFVLGVSSIILIGKKNRWGFVLALLAQPFWFYTAYVHQQWGVFGANFVYMASWLYGFYQWFIKKEK
ncbi:MAG: nicotinamide mononucleotide transporter [Candidatus Liptonbacteria bacterium]|nr:nicotinamide mononucleotide transporter [Candidatus Liptonbacteria bacterium]